jgi:IcmF-related N-terminal domain
MAFLRWLWDGARRIIGLVLPVFSKVGDWRRYAPALIWTLRIIALVAFLALLWLANRVFQLHEILGRAPNQFLQQFWLPLVGLVFVVVCWLAWWVWQLLRPEVEESNFPDIDQAWEEAVRALNDSGTDLTSVPLFLVLGRPNNPEDTLFQAAELRTIVRQAPRRPDAPLHVYAFKDGRYDSVFVTCAGASLLGKQAAILNGFDTGEEATTTQESVGSANAEDIFKTAKPEGEVKELLQILREAKRQGRDLTEEERAQIRRLERKGRPPLLKSPVEVQLASARLRHLCRLVARDRRPFCAINGLVVLVPWLATDSDEEAAQTSTICQHDLQITREVFKLNCPVVALLVDMEKTAGFREFVQRFPTERLKQRLGQRFPLVPDVERSALPGKIDSAAKWISDSLFPTWIYKFLRLESAGEGNPGEMTQANGRLVRLMCQIGERQRRLSQLLVRGIVGEPNGPPLFGGCYVVGLGIDSTHPQAFVPGVFRKVIENQDFVSWTPDALAEDSQYLWWTKLGYVGIGMAVVAAIVVGYFLNPWRGH